MKFAKFIFADDHQAIEGHFEEFIRTAFNEL